jgi:hypothetical protein
VAAAPWSGVGRARRAGKMIQGVPLSLGRKRLPGIVAVIASMAAAGCSNASLSPITGLTGVVSRGPVTPVCRVDVPCDAPFSATFTVQKSGRQVAQFRSDASGQFTVFLQPGGYIVVPAADAPILSPSAQAKSVSVADSGTLTTIRLMFDTGIR